MKYQQQTNLAIENFGKGSVPPKLIVAYAEVKKAALLAIQNIENYYDEKEFLAIIEAIDEIIQQKLNDEFVIPLLQGGAGTSFNMNINEVIATRAEEILLEKYGICHSIHPIDDINRYQSTNDTFPTAIIITMLRDLNIVEKLTVEIQEALVEKEKKFSNILIMGRTELQDALPMTLQQVFGSWAGMFERDRWRLHKLKERIRNVPLGGTAIGTGFPTPLQYLFKVEIFLREVTKLPLSRSQNLPDSIANHDDLSELASGYLLLANNLQKLSDDFLLYTSSFCKEMSHPELQYGSTIMPFKVNPVLLEYVKGICIKIKHLGHLVEDYNIEGNLQLNAFLPFIAETLIEIGELLFKALKAMKKFIEKLIINEDNIRTNLNHSMAIFNLLLPFLGYSKSKQFIKNLPDLSNIEKIREWLLNNGIDEQIVQNLSSGKITNFIKKK